MQTAAFEPNAAAGCKMSLYGVKSLRHAMRRAGTREIRYTPAWAYHHFRNQSRQAFFNFKF